MSTDDPRRQGTGAPPSEPYVEAAARAVEQLANRAKVPAWVANPEKWQSMTRAERRATERYHRKQVLRER